MDQVARDFAFLVTDWEFIGPLARPGLYDAVFERADLLIRVWFWTGYMGDCGLETDIAESATDANGDHRYGGLGTLYVGAGLGPAQHVPGGRALRKHLTQHAAALRRLMPKVVGPEWDDLVTCFRSVAPLPTLFEAVDAYRWSPGDPVVEP